MRESGITDKQEEPFFEISAEDASALGIAEGDWARLVSRRGDARGARRTSPSASTPASSGWRSTSPSEGELAHARRRRPAHRDARVQGLAPCASSSVVSDSLAPEAVARARPRALRQAVPLRARVRVDAAPARRLGAARGSRRRRPTTRPADAAGMGRHVGGARRAARSSCSVLLHPPPERHLPELSLVAALAVAEAVEGATGLAAQIKWPNDVMLNRRKVAGILCRARRRRGRRRDRHQRQPDARRASARCADRARLAPHAHRADVRPRARFSARSSSDSSASTTAGATAGSPTSTARSAPRDFLRGRRITVDGEAATALQILRDGRLEIATGNGHGADAQRSSRARCCSSAELPSIAWTLMRR